MQGQSIVRLPLFLMLGAFVLPLPGCGSSADSPPMTDARPASTRANTEQRHTVAPASSAGSACPLTEAEVSRAIGETVPLVPGPPTPTSICTFATTTSAGVDLNKPGVTVMPFPAQGQPTTLAALSSELSGFGEAINHRPQWGSGAFFTVEETSAMSIDVFVRDTNTLVFAPLGSITDPQAAAEELGDAISGK
jgi:hypothetical protein